MFLVAWSGLASAQSTGKYHIKNLQPVQSHKWYRSAIEHA